MEVGYSGPFDHFLSLGNSCTVKYQTSLNIIRRAQPDISPAEFWKHLFLAGSTLLPEGTHFFDWLTTPFESLLEILDAGLEGVFERRNLALNAAGTTVIDRRFGIGFDHAFSKVGDLVAPEAIEREFASQQRKIIYLKEKFMSATSSCKTMLYVVQIDPDEKRYQLLPDALRRGAPSHRFHVLFVTTGEADLGLVEAAADHTVYRIHSQIRKPSFATWTGDDQQWQDLLDAIPLRQASRTEALHSARVSVASSPASPAK